jgi:hypothetical protein
MQRIRRQAASTANGGREQYRSLSRLQHFGITRGARALGRGRTTIEAPIAVPGPAKNFNDARYCAVAVA